jgi:hypothetical protein
MAGKTNPDRDCDRDVGHELQVARYLAGAFIEQCRGIGMDYGRKKHAHLPVGLFWIDIARQVIAHTSKHREQPDFSAAIS